MAKDLTCTTARKQEGSSTSWVLSVQVDHGQKLLRNKNSPFHAPTAKDNMMAIEIYLKDLEKRTFS